MYETCCDPGEKMPSYYLQTLGGNPYSTDWDFSRMVPDMMIINLGCARPAPIRPFPQEPPHHPSPAPRARSTNDFGHDAGPAWEANFTATYVAFVKNATARYSKPQLPIFVAQGPMNNGASLYNALQAAITAVNAAGGNAVYLDLRGPPNDGCGGHPGVQGHLQMAALAIPQINATMAAIWGPST